MSATGTVSVQHPDGAVNVGFVRGFACLRDPHPASDARSAVMASPVPSAQEPAPEFRLTTVLPDVAVEIEVGAFTRE